jgi:hypothetical protein
MATNERQEFRKWAGARGLSSDDVELLLQQLLDDYALNPAYPSWIGSPTRVMSANDPTRGFGLEKEPFDLGFLLIGSCPNGDPVAVNIREPELPVYYISHEGIYSEPLPEIMAKVSGSLAEYRAALASDTSRPPLDYWDT